MSTEVTYLQERIVTLERTIERLLIEKRLSDEVARTESARASMLAIELHRKAVVTERLTNMYLRHLDTE